MKKILSILCFLVFFNNAGICIPYEITENEIKEVENFFNSFVDSANNYDSDLIGHYDKNARIERIVLKPDGEKQSVFIPMARYIKELKSGRKLARLVKYKNRYINKKYEKISNNEYKVTSKRIPFKDNEALNAEFTITRTDEGLKISHEALETTVQKFLNAK